MNTPIITAQSLTKVYQSTRALAGVDISITAGQSLAIMGPSGSGKTTLLHALAGIIPVTEGRVLLHAPGRQDAAPTVVNELSTAKRTALRASTFGFVFQQGLLMPELTATENVALAGMLGGMKRPQAEQHALDWLAALGLTGHGDKRIGQLSGGQQQRVAIARSQMNDPLVTFADEPTGALDSGTSAEVLDILLRSTVGRGRTLVMVTHDSQVASTCHRLVTLRDGRIASDTAAQQAAPAAQQAAPAAQPAPADTHTRPYAPAAPTLAYAAR